MKGKLPIVLIFCLFLLACIGIGSSHAADIDWPQVKVTPIVSAAGVTSITHAGDGSGRLFFTEQAGLIRVLQGTNLQLTPFLDISDRVTNYIEMGLLSVAFSPGFETNRLLYVHYCRTNDSAVVVSEFSADPTGTYADRDSERILLSVEKPSIKHNGGQLAFGPDDYLYISIGDGGIPFDPYDNAQNLKLLLGKILRIDPTGGNPYRIPDDNPFATNPEARPEIWAYGLRNPWRFSFDRLTGDLFIADVGEMRNEEVNHQPANSNGGENYGWRMKEGAADHQMPGNFNTNTLTPPIITYTPVTGGCVIGGYLYRGPSSGRLSGFYFFGDFRTGRIFASTKDGSQWKMRDVSGLVGSIRTFGEDEEGRLYVVREPNTIALIEDNGMAFAPYFSPSPSGGTLYDNVVTVECDTTNATIRYTFEARDPIESDLEITPGTTLTVTNGTQIRAQAFRADLSPSKVTTLSVSQTRIAPVRISSLQIPTNGLVELTCETPGVQIFYDLNAATAPTTNSTLYTGPFRANPGDKIRSIATKPGMGTTAEMTATFTLFNAPAPFVIPPGGEVTYGTALRIFSTIPNASIYYTLDGSTPTTNSSPYTASIPLTNDMTDCRAIAVASNYGPGSIARNAYTLPVVHLTFTPPFNTRLIGPTEMTFASTTPGASIYYSLGGTATTNSTLYTQPFVVNAGTSIGFLGVAPHYRKVQGSLTYPDGDTDKDGIPDVEETSASGFVVGVDDRNVDSDGDGYTNAQEYIAGTSPLSAASRLELSGSRLDDQVTLSWNAVGSRSYQVYSSSNLISWQLVTNFHAVQPATLTITPPTPLPSGYFRLQVTKP